MIFLIQSDYFRYIRYDLLTFGTKLVHLILYCRACQPPEVIDAEGVCVEGSLGLQKNPNHQIPLQPSGPNPRPHRYPGVGGQPGGL